MGTGTQPPWSAIRRERQRQQLCCWSVSASATPTSKYFKNHSTAAHHLRNATVTHLPWALASATDGKQLQNSSLYMAWRRRIYTTVQLSLSSCQCHEQIRTGRDSSCRDCRALRKPVGPHLEREMQIPWVRQRYPGQYKASLRHCALYLHAAPVAIPE